MHSVGQWGPSLASQDHTKGSWRNWKCTRSKIAGTEVIVLRIEVVDPSAYFTFPPAAYHATRQAVSVTEDGTLLPTNGNQKGPSRLDLRAQFFTQRMTWNSLPLSVKNSASTNSVLNQFGLVRPYSALFTLVRPFSVLLCLIRPFSEYSTLFGLIRTCSNLFRLVA